MLKYLLYPALLTLALTSTFARRLYGDDFSSVSKSLPYAKIAAAIYFDQGPLPERKVDGYKLVDYRAGEYYGYSSGFAAATYQKGTEIVIVFRGTDSNDSKVLISDDWRNNINGALFGIATVQDFNAIDYAEAMLNKFPGKSITVTGHSLGGRLAQVTSEVYNLNAVTFNSAAVPYTWHLAAYDSNFRSHEIINIITEGEIVNKGSSYNAQDFGKDIYIPSNARKGILARHSMDNVVKSISDVISYGYLPNEIIDQNSRFIKYSGPLPENSYPENLLGSIKDDAADSFVGISKIKDFNYLIEEKGLLNSYTYSSIGSNKGRIRYEVDWTPYAGTWEDTFNFSSTKSYDYSMTYHSVEEVHIPSVVGTGKTTVYTHVSDKYNYLIWGGAGENSSPTVLGPGLWIMGKITPENDMPKTGTASYKGSVIGYADREINGGINLTADFKNKSVAGTLNCTYRDNGRKFATATLSSVKINDPDKGAFLGDLSGSNIKSGSIGGAFFGKKAEEIGGFWKIEKKDGPTGHGIFVGKKQ